MKKHNIIIKIGEMIISVQLKYLQGIKKFHCVKGLWPASPLVPPLRVGQKFLLLKG